MWILWGILLFLAVLCVTVLLLPVRIVVKLDEGGEPQLRVKLLWMTFGDEDNEPWIARMFKKGTGASSSGKKAGKPSDTVSGWLRDGFGLIGDLLRELVGLFGRCRAQTLKLHIVCADDDAAGAAMAYGTCCAVVMPVWGYLHTLVDVRPAGEDLDISCDYQAEKSRLVFEAVLVVRVFRILAAVVRTAMAEAE